jgi:hypothetical protein
MGVSACVDQQKYQTLSGTWVCESWINTMTQNDQCTQDNVLFRFYEDKTYYSKLGDGIDTGIFRIVSGVMYVEPIGKTEFGVKVKELEPNKVILEMNNAGEIEYLTLKRP